MNVPNSTRRTPWWASPWTWILATVAIRLAALIVIPLKPDALLDRDRGPLGQVDGRAPTFWEILNRRTELRMLDQDERAYDDIGLNLAAGRGFVLDRHWMINTPGQPTMYAGAGYPAFVGACYFVFGQGRQLPVYLLQIVLHGLAAGLLVLTAARLAGPVAGGLSGLFFTFHPPLIWLSVAMMSENAMVPLVAAMLWLLLVAKPGWGGRSWVRPLVLGGVLGALAQTRSTFAPYPLVAALWLVIEARRSRPRWRAWIPATVLGAVFVAICLPWTVRNYQIWGKFIPFSTKSGINAYFCNHDGLEVEFGRRAVDGPQPIDVFDPRIQSLPDEPARNDALRAMFYQFVREKPGKFLGLVWMRFWLAVTPVQLTSTTKSALIAAWYTKGIALVALVSLAGLAVAGRLPWKRFAWRMAPLLLFIGMWQAIQSLAGAGMRYRTPVEPAYTVLVGVAGAVVLALLLPRGPAGPPASRWIRRRPSS